jgi:hypothetical protein
MSKCVGWTHSGSRLKFRPSVNFQFTQSKKSRKTMTALASKRKWSHPNCKLSCVRRLSNLCRIQFHFFLLFSKCTVSQRSYRSLQVWVPVMFFCTYLQGNIMQQHQHQSSLTQRKAHHHNVTRLYDVQLSDCNRKVALKDPGIDSFGYLAFGPCSTSSFTPRVIWHSYEKWMNTACSRDDLPIKHSDFQLLHYQRVGLGSSDSSHSWCT